jgi:hypothetical protein
MRVVLYRDAFLVFSGTDWFGDRQAHPIRLNESIQAAAETCSQLHLTSEQQNTDTVEGVVRACTAQHSGGLHE